MGRSHAAGFGSATGPMDGKSGTEVSPEKDRSHGPEQLRDFRMASELYVGGGRGFSPGAYLIRRIFFFAFIATCVLFCAGCGSSSSSNASDSGGSSSSSTSVSSVTPAQGATNVAVNAAIQVTFSSPVTLNTVNSTNIQVTGAQPFAGAVTYDSDSDTATFTPSAAYAPNTKYTVKVSGVTDTSGKALAAFTSSFTTGQSSAAANDNTVEYQATLFPAQGVGGSGQIYIVNCGCVTIQMTGAQASTTLGVLFCPAYPSGSPSAPCFSVGSIETDASGGADQTIHFPKPGTWAGDFQLDDGNAVQFSTSLVAPGAAGGSDQVYLATLEPLTTVNSGALQPAGSSQKQSSMSAGTVTWFNGALQFSMTGGAPNTSYLAIENIDALGSSSSYSLSNSQHQSAFSSDASGNLSFSVLQDGSTGDLFELEPQNNQAGYIGGFTIPD